MPSSATMRGAKRREKEPGNPTQPAMMHGALGALPQRGTPIRLRGTA